MRTIRTLKEWTPLLFLIACAAIVLTSPEIGQALGALFEVRP